MAATDKATFTSNSSGPGNIPLVSKTDFAIAALTAGNFTAKTAAVATLESAYSALTGAIIRSSSISITTPFSDAVPGSTVNRGQKWILTAQNTAGRIFTYTIPGAPGSGELNSDNITADLTGTHWAAFKTAFEAVATDPDGNALTLLRAKLGGRRA